MRYSVPCETCGKDCGKKQYLPKHGDFCSHECRAKSKKSTCVVCGQEFVNKDRKTRTCKDTACRKIISSRPSTRTQVECQWCGKLHGVKKKNSKEHHCSRHCRDSRIRLKQYVKLRLRAAKKRLRKIQVDEKNKQSLEWWKDIREWWVKCQLARIEKEQNRCFSEDELWFEKIDHLCGINRYREQQSTRKSSAAWTKHTRNQSNDWKYGGAWGRVICLELKRLSMKVNACTHFLWMVWLQNRMSSQRKRMRKKQVAGCRHGH